MSEVSVIGYMREQPERLRYVFKNREVFIQPFLEACKGKKKILFFGSGTSYNVSLLATYYFKHICHIDAQAYYPNVFKYYEQPDWSNSLKKEEILFVGISQSGTSVSTCEIMEYAKANGYPTLALTGNLESKICDYVDTKVHLLVGDELLPPETKGYTVSVLTVYLWAIALAKVDGYDQVEKLVNQFDQVIVESEAWYERNKVTIVNSNCLYAMGYGIDFATAIEAQLKIGEMLRLPIVGYEMVEYSHGPTMALNPKHTLFMIGSDEPEWNQMIEYRKAFKQYTDRVHVITCKELDEKDDKDLVFSVKTNKYLAPLMYTVPFQFVAAKGAKDIGIDTAINPFEIALTHYE